MENEVVKCRFCGNETRATGTKMCNNCWEVVSRLPEFLKHENGISLVIDCLLETNFITDFEKITDLFRTIGIYFYAIEKTEEKQIRLGNSVVLLFSGASGKFIGTGHKDTDTLYPASKLRKCTFNPVG